MSSEDRNKALVEDSVFAQNTVFTGDSIATNFDKRVEHTLQLMLCKIPVIPLTF